MQAGVCKDRGGIEGQGFACPGDAGMFPAKGKGDGYGRP